MLHQKGLFFVLCKGDDVSNNQMVEQIFLYIKMMHYGIENRIEAENIQGIFIF